MPGSSSSYLLAGCLALSLSGTTALAETASFDHTHAAFDSLLKTHVRDGLVDYRALQQSPGDLDRYLDALASVSASVFDGWTESRQLAFLINLYNASTLQLIGDHYPVKSIKDIGTLFQGPWDQPAVRLWGGVITLNTLEHEIIRKRYALPEIHFALVCAARGCPSLRGEAFVADRLSEQLADQRRAFLATPGKNAVEPDRKRVRLSPIFKWYAGDFAKSAGSVLGYLKLHGLAVDESFSIAYTTYDWTLNEP